MLCVRRRAEVVLSASLCLIAAILAPMSATAQLAPQAPLGDATQDAARYADILKAQRCMEFTLGVTGGAIAKDMDQNTAQPTPAHIRDFFTAVDGQKKTLQDTRYVGMPNNLERRPSGWTYADLMGQGSTGFRGEVYRRYKSPADAAPGTYNLTFAVLSDQDEIFVCIQGTEPEVFPSIGKAPQGNTMNNLDARPAVLKAFDEQAMIHMGWAKVAHHYQQVITPILREHGIANKKLTITGHSQGAVMAGYIGFLLVKAGTLPRMKPHRIVTLAAPRYGTASFHERFKQALEANSPKLTIDALETDGDLVPGFWPLGQLPTGQLWRAIPREVGFTINITDALGHHRLEISAYHAQKIIETRGAYRGPTVVIDAVGAAVKNSLEATCPAGFKKTALSCVATSCPSGLERRGDQCVSVCPANTTRSATGAHCMTKTTPYKQTTQKVWVGHLQKPEKYRGACPAGTSFSHDLAGYAHCTKGSCPASHPTRRGGSCHGACGTLQTDTFGNCVVETHAPHTIEHQCPPGTKRQGPLCVK